MQRIFILSPANSGGERANLLYNPRAGFELAHRLHRGETVALAEVFSFLSGLYFRGKFTYAVQFGRVPRGKSSVFVITPNRGLLCATTKVSLADLRSFATVPIDPADPRYFEPLRRDALALAGQMKPTSEVVLLGSISTKKYVEVLEGALGDRLLFPIDFVGRGDMSRGGLLLRRASENVELEYRPVAGAIRRGQRPAKLEPRRWGYKILSGTTDCNKTCSPKSG